MLASSKGDTERLRLCIVESSIARGQQRSNELATGDWQRSNFLFACKLHLNAQLAPTTEPADKQTALARSLARPQANPIATSHFNQLIRRDYDCTTTSRLPPQCVRVRWHTLRVQPAVGAGEMLAGGRSAALRRRRTRRRRCDLRRDNLLDSNCVRALTCARP